MRVTPKTEKEIYEADLLPDGWYPMTIFKAEEKVSKKGIEMIEDFFKEHGRADLIEKAMEVGFLRNWRSEIAQQLPVSEPERLEQLLKEAVEQENFERAAELRDRLRALKGQTTS